MNDVRHLHDLAYLAPHPSMEDASKVSMSKG